MQRRKQAKEIRNEINKINEELKDIPSAIARRQAEIQNLEQQLNTIKSKYQPDLQRLESIISNIRSQIEKTTDPQALAQLYQQRQTLEAERSRIIQEMNEETKPTVEEIAEKQNELKDITSALIAKRREQYEKLRGLKPEGIFGTIVKSTLEPFQKKKQKVKIPKKAFEEAGIEIEEEKKEESKQNQQSQGQKKP
jgi:archaellum component FlaC